MAASGKKGKKQKGKTLVLSEFLAEGHGSIGSGQTVVMAPSKSSWADEMVEDDTLYKEKLVLPTAPRATRGADIDENKIPNNPPYTAYIANLPYDMEQDDIGKFFQGLRLKGVRLPREGEGGRLRGFGYAEFETRQDLVEALMMNELLIKNRKIRVDIATGKEGEGEQQGRGRGRAQRNEEPREDRTPSDWRSAPRELPPAQDKDRYRGDREDRVGRYEPGFNPRERGSGYGGPPERSSFGPRKDGSSFGRDRDRFADRERETPKERPKLTLKPRSIPLEETVVAPSAGPPVASAGAPSTVAPGPSSSSIFGGAKPVDTAAREREIEERLREKEREKESEPRDRAPVRQETRESRDGSRGSGRSPERYSGRGRSSEADRKEYDDDKYRGRDRPSNVYDDRKTREWDSKASDRDHRDYNRSRESDREYKQHRDGEYRGQRDTDRDYRSSRDSDRDHRPPRDSDRDYRQPRDSDRDYKQYRDDRDYRPPRDSDRDYRHSRESDRDYRSQRDTDREYRSYRDGDREPRQSRDDEPRKENGHYRGGGSSSSGGGGGVYKAPIPRGSGQNRSSSDKNRPREQRDSDREPPRRSGRSSSPEDGRIRRYEEPKAPVFEDRNKFSFLEDENESDGHDEQD